MFGKKKQYSYIKKPFAKNGWISLALSFISFFVTQGLLCASIINHGNVGKLSSALALCAVFIAFPGAAFGVAGLGEKEKNHIMVFISVFAEIMVLVEWVLILL